ncbi:hypothetical protein OHA84_00810 [Streptomyces sp. NBC_00513]|uniref:hypothetical protein n=1 Tax=unclassified Streptomyces TaxID=2593676 RepID=UPI00225A7AD2|nr:hypothetical protein [Streptomyces sp. NBC_00424]MCX5078720.1 hypothetical protein [Streptomyces sp. NBC_00424]WUD39162.1 hypothetical protein OHA84_00810 [Streptomyces sp. NBC_00513]
MTAYKAATTFLLTAGAAAALAAAAAPASAGGIGDILSPAFGTNCANHDTVPHATGATTTGTGAADGNLLGLPLGSPLNQCGGADMPDGGGDIDSQNGLANLYDVPIGVLGSASNKEIDRPARSH